MSTQCYINFVNKDNDVFSPGDTLKCRIELITKKLKTVKEINVTVTGIGNVEWAQSKQSSEIVDEEIYLQTKTIIKKSPNEEHFPLVPGIYSYDFETKLPSSLPTSFRGTFGEILYEVKVTISRPLEFDNEFIKPFTVIRQVDLNQITRFKNPIDIAEEKHNFFMFLKTTPFRLKVHIPHSGYVSGQMIPCHIDAVNESKITCRKITVKLHRFIQYSNTNDKLAKPTIEKIKISKVGLPEVRASSKENFVALLLVPPTPPSSGDTVKIIHIGYIITIEAIMEGYHRNCTVTTPIDIGTIPIIDSLTNPNEPINRVSSLKRSIEPPVYEESQAMKKFFVNPKRNKFINSEPYTPKYPFYKNISHKHTDPGTLSESKFYFSTFC